MPPLLRRPVSAGARLRPGRSFSEVPHGTLLRGLYLEAACAPAFTWQLTRSRDNQDQPIRVSTLSGEPQVIALAALFLIRRYLLHDDDG